MKKGDHIMYQPRGGLYRIRAVVRTLHKDQSVTVEPFFALDFKGRDMRGFIGGRVRLHREDVQPLPPVINPAPL